MHARKDKDRYTEKKSDRSSRIGGESVQVETNRKI